VSNLSTLITCSDILSWMLFVFGSRQWIAKCEAQLFMPRWMVSLNVIYSGSLVASMSALISFAHLEGPCLEEPHHIVHCHVHCIVGICNITVLRTMCRCRGRFIRDCWMVYRYWHLLEWNYSWDWLRRESQHHMSFFRVLEGKGIITNRFVLLYGGMCSSSRVCAGVHQGVYCIV